MDAWELIFFLDDLTPQELEEWANELAVPQDMFDRMKATANVCYYPGMC